MTGIGTSRTEILKGCPCQTTARMVSFRDVIVEIILKRLKMLESSLGRRWGFKDFRIELLDKLNCQHLPGLLLYSPRYFESTHRPKSG
jgi:hypothetical protein